ncbi:MAG: 2-C-methyl-D-erythritol 2,4-cyclodiphosphate synthase [Pirellulales bacterium]|nr:2-C-methyl-D-erythritol 2,4-cyclodiphosphate synthase [Pirellulales bacterium]
MRIGLGEDTHRLVAGGPLRLGGIDIPHDHHAQGHSDADVLLHAVTDALLGAAGLPDIGQLFPDDLEENRHRDSAEMLYVAYEHVQRAGFNSVNLDCVIAAESPKLAPHKEAVCRRMAEILAIEPSRVNIKAKTGEGVGPIGEQKIIQARCVALLEKKREL